MSGKYQMEIDNFIQRFGSYKDSRIVLYGIGRYTATLLEGLEGFNIVGLMDKDPENIGRMLHNVPIVDKNTAERTADLVIINTAETYWNVIYNRIKDIGIPVYYINGKKAQEKEDRKVNNSFNELSYSGLLAETEKAEFISFDFFDTLFMRSVCSPQDIFRIMERQTDIPITQMRDRAKRHIRENYSLDELYRQIEMLENIPHDQITAMRNAEIELEKKLLVPRSRMLSLLRNLLERNRKVYIVSDMYLPKDFYVDIFNRQGIFVSDEAILLSNELDANKLDGTLWKYYAENIVRGKPALHIGDNTVADIEKPMEYGIGTYLTPNMWEMLLNSSLKNTASYICGIYDTGVMGCILSKLFENPFVLHGTDGVPGIENNHDMGYCVFGPVIMTFMMWLLDKTEEDGIKKLVFMSRDGYFLKEDFEYICGLLGEKKECCYIGISRQLAMMASIETKQDLTEYMQMPYTGNLTEMLEDRFGIICGADYADSKQSERYMDEHLTEMEKRIAGIRKNYLCYLERFELNDSCAVIDIGYYGNNQKYLNKLLRLKMAGYYFNANLSVKNGNAKIQKMTACFQSSSDSTGENSRILNKQIYLESFFTAPYGMVRAVDEKGDFICAPDGKNQECFHDKEEINEGVKQFIADYIERFGTTRIKPDVEFADKYYGSCFDGCLEFADEVKKSFYNDNAMMNRIESSLFY